MKIMGININDIKTIVISHEHFDHTGGLQAILRERPGIDVYVCPAFSKAFKQKVKSLGGKVIEAEAFKKITDGIYTTGEIPNTYSFHHIPEQALVIETENGLTILTGCAHSGVDVILEHVMKYINGDIYLLLGGFHLIDEPFKKIAYINSKLKKIGVKNIGPSHCTGVDAINVFKTSYGDNFIDIKIGKIIDV